jgi:hypothetical protein
LTAVAWTNSLEVSEYIERSLPAALVPWISARRGEIAAARGSEPACGIVLKVVEND